MVLDAPARLAREEEVPRHGGVEIEQHGRGGEDAARQPGDAHHIEARRPADPVEPDDPHGRDGARDARIGQVDPHGQAGLVGLHGVVEDAERDELLPVGTDEDLGPLAGGGLLADEEVGPRPVDEARRGEADRDRGARGKGEEVHRVARQPGAVVAEHDAEGDGHGEALADGPREGVAAIGPGDRPSGRIDEVEHQIGEDRLSGRHGPTPSALARKTH